MPQPTDLPTWATGGSAAIVDPPASKKETGYIGGEKPPAEHFNWMLNRICRWLAYLKGLPNEAITWRARQTFQGGASAPTPLQADDVATKAYVDSAAGGSPNPTVHTYDVGEPEWAASPQNRLVFWKDPAGWVNFVGEVIPQTTGAKARPMGVLPAGMRPAKAVLVSANMYPHVVAVTVMPDGKMLLDSVDPIVGRPVCFDGGRFKAVQ